MGRKRKSDEFRQAEYRQKKQVEILQQRCPIWFQAGWTIDPENWNYLWYARENRTVKLLLASSLHILFALLHTWNYADRTQHSSPFYALLWFKNLNLDADHQIRLKNYVQRLSKSHLTDNNAIRQQNDWWREEVYSKGEKMQYELVKKYIHTGKWTTPRGENDDKWSNWTDWKGLLASECQGVKMKKLYAHLWPIFVKASRMNEEELAIEAHASLFFKYMSISLCFKSPMYMTQESRAAPSRSEPSVNEPITISTLTDGTLTFLSIEHNTCLNAIKTANWIDDLPKELEEDLATVFDLCSKHLLTNSSMPQDLMKHAECPSSPVLWAAIANECLRTMEYRKLLPEWFQKPEHRALLSPAGATPASYFDPGNKNLEILWFVLRVYRFVQLNLREAICSPALTPYGSATNRSGKGITNKRGNMLEAILTYCYQQD